MAAVQLAGGTYSQDFDTLSNVPGSTTNTALPTGWGLAESGGGARDHDDYAVDNGGSNTGDTYSYGAAGSLERAFGTLQSGVLIPIIGAEFQNASGKVVTALDIQYTGEEWRLGTAGRTDRLQFEISTNATSLDDPLATWVGISALDFTTLDTTTVGAKDGNAANERTTLSAHIVLNVALGGTFFVRWKDLDASMNDDGLAIDDFSLSTTPTNTAPTDMSLSAAAAQETAANGTVVGTLSSTDADAGETFTYSLSDNASGRFAVVGNELRVADGILLDFEQSASHTVTVHVVDSGGKTFDKQFVIAVGDVNPENVTGDARANTIHGGDGNDTLAGMGDNDTLAGRGGNDLLNGGDGADTLDGGAGDDVLDGGAGQDTLNGGADNDTYVMADGNDLVQDTGGSEDLATSTVTRSLVGLAGIENLTLLGGNIDGTGNALDNLITGTAGINHLFGGNGNDRLVGRGGNDALGGGAGNDTLDGGTGNDHMNGGTGNDTYIVDSAGDVLVDTAGIDLVLSRVPRGLPTGFENLTLTGSAGIAGTGNAAANVITGNGGNNVLSGLAGNDTLNGGGGNDRVVGGQGRDVMTGGRGRDVFDFNTVAEIGKGAVHDVIKDFAHGFDHIDLSTIDANGAAAGNGKFALLAKKGAAFTGLHGQLHWLQVNVAGTVHDKTIVEGDVNGDKVADFQLELSGLKTLAAGDFVL